MPRQRRGTLPVNAARDGAWGGRLCRPTACLAVTLRGPLSLSDASGPAGPVLRQPDRCAHPSSNVFTASSLSPPPLPVSPLSGALSLSVCLCEFRSLTSLGSACSSVPRGSGTALVRHRSSGAPTLLQRRAARHRSSGVRPATAAAACSPCRARTRRCTPAAARTPSRPPPARPARRDPSAAAQRSARAARGRPKCGAAPRGGPGRGSRLGGCPRW